jgi:hypothetical protein
MHHQDYCHPDRDDKRRIHQGMTSPVNNDHRQNKSRHGHRRPACPLQTAINRTTALQPVHAGPKFSQGVARSDNHHRAQKHRNWITLKKGNDYNRTAGQGQSPKDPPQLWTAQEQKRCGQAGEGSNTCCHHPPEWRSSSVAYHGGKHKRDRGKYH